MRSSVESWAGLVLYREVSRATAKKPGAVSSPGAIPEFRFPK
jgi:hypothetical protein